MSTDPDAIRSDIERTRTELSSDVDALTDKVSPGRVLHRQGDRLRSAGGSLRDRVMGSAHDAAHGAGDRLGEARDTVTSTPDLVRERTAGSPLAAGIVAFGLGLVASALIPASRPEQQLAQAAKEQGEPLVDEAKRAASEVAQNLKEPARDAASQVADTAKQAAQGVRDEAQGARDEVADRARDAQQSVRQSTTGATSGMPGSGSGEGVAATFAPATTFEPEETGGGPAAGPLPGDERTSRP
jgi:gas vesicle protein